MLSEIVFGSAGFIGTNYLTLSAQRNIKIIEVPNQASFHNFISHSSDFGLYDMPNVIWLSGKVSSNSDPIKNKGLFDWDLSSLEQTLILLHDLDWSGRFVLISSGGCVYRDMERPIKESDNLLPNNAYGDLKLRQENLLLSSGLSFSILRVSNVFGPKRSSSNGQNVIENWITSYKSGHVCKVYGYPESYRDYINVVDVASAIMRSLESSMNNSILNIGSGLKTTLGELMGFFNEATFNTAKFHFEDFRSSDRLGYVLNIDKARNEIDWSPKKSNHRDIFAFLSKELKNV